MSSTPIELPKDFSSRIKKQFLSAAPDFIKAIEQPPTISFRINQRKIVPSQKTDNIVLWCDTGYYLQERINFTTDPWFQSGAYYVQEAGSMFLWHILKQLYQEEYPNVVLDLCGAPGGKTTLLSSFLPAHTLIVSNEVIHSRAEVLKQNVDRWGDANVVVTNNDPKDFSRLSGMFDLCVVDAPCSGEGLFRREPQSVAQWNVENTRLCAQRQRRILMDIWPAIKPGGILIYSTCTFNPEENEENLAWLASQHTLSFPDISVEPSWGIEKIESRGVVGFRFAFHKTRSEGFFVSVVRKEDADERFNAKPGKPKKQPIIPPKETIKKVEKWSNSNFFWYQNNTIFASDIHPQTIAFLNENLRVVRSGCLIATDYNRKLTPEHPLALSSSLKPDAFPSIEVSDEDAYRFLKNSPLSFPGLAKNRYLLTWRGVPIGFINHLGNRTNTSLPTNYRILRDFDFNGESIAGIGFIPIRKN